MRGLLSAANILLLCTSGVLAAQPWPAQTYQTESFAVPKFVVERNGKTEDGVLFLGYRESTVPDEAGPLIVKDSGELIWRGPGGGPTYNFRRQLLNGQIVLTYWTGVLDFQGHGFGNVSILDRDYNEIHNICLPESENIYNPRNNYPTDHYKPCFVDKHESLITDDGTILVTAYNATQTDLTSVGGQPDGWIWDCLFYELDIATGDIVFKWSAIDHINPKTSNWVNTSAPTLLELNGRTQGTKKLPWDFFHINSVQKIDGGYLINSRMTWSLYKVNGNTKDIDWTLEGSHGGDFTYNQEVFFSWQHMPRINPQNMGANTMEVQLFNNDNIPDLADGKNSSSGYLFNLNFNTMEATVLRNPKPQNPIYGVAEGSYQDLDNDHVLIGYGAIPIVQEFDENDNIIYSAQFGPNQEGAPHSYRAYRLPWKSTPQTSPKVAAFHGAKVRHRITTYMSWNGATEVDSWNVYAGPTQDNLARVVTGKRKKGFETSVSFKSGKNKYKFIMAQALNGGQELGNSTVQAIQPAQGATI